MHKISNSKILWFFSYEFKFRAYVKDINIIR